jgi:hypothetical protein
MEEKYLELKKEIGEIRKKLKELQKKEKEYEQQILETMQNLQTEKLGNIVLERKKVLKGEFDKKTVRDKIASQLMDPVKTDNLTEQIFRKEVVYKDILKIKT